MKMDGEKYLEGYQDGIADDAVGTSRNCLFRDDTDPPDQEATEYKKGYQDAMGWRR